MNQPQPFSDHKIRQTVEALKADGQNVTPWAVQSRLGGGDFLRIQQIIDQFFPGVNAQSMHTQAPSMHFGASTPNPSSSQSVQANNEILDKQMPAGVEASMYHMQTTLGQMANQLWSDAASNAENQVRDKLFSAQQAQAQAQEAHAQAEKTNQNMQKTISQLTAEKDVLNVDYKKAVETLAQEQSQLKETQKQCNALQKNVDSLESENQTLEQTAFNSNIQAAKAEGLAEIIKEQLELAKQSEKHIQKALDRSEKKVSALNREMHNTSQTLRDEMRERHVPLHPVKKAAPASAPQAPREYPPQQLPEPSAANIEKVAANSVEQSPIAPLTPSATPPVPLPATPLTPSAQPSNAPTNPAPPPELTPEQIAAANNTKSIQDLGHSLVMSRAQKVAQAKTRSLSDKLFDRKKRQFNNKNK